MKISGAEQTNRKAFIFDKYFRIPRYRTYPTFWKFTDI